MCDACVVVYENFCLVYPCNVPLYNVILYGYMSLWVQSVIMWELYLMLSPESGVFVRIGGTYLTFDSALRSVANLCRFNGGCIAARIQWV